MTLARHVYVISKNSKREPGTYILCICLFMIFLFSGDFWRWGYRIKFLIVKVIAIIIELEEINNLKKRKLRGFNIAQVVKREIDLGRSLVVIIHIFVIVFHIDFFMSLSWGPQLLHSSESPATVGNIGIWKNKIK